MNNTKTILLSDRPIPNHKIGSWSNMYLNYLKRKDHLLDYVICEKPKEKLVESVSYELLKKGPIEKCKELFLYSKRFDGYLNALNRILKRYPENHFILQVVDNTGLIFALLTFFEKNKIRNKFFLQYFFHGFKLDLPQSKTIKLLSSIDNLVLLTELSKSIFLNEYPQISIPVDIIHNGIDTSKFFSLSKAQKQKLKNEKGIDDEIIFVWCANKQEKKGLHIALEAWGEIVKRHKNVMLWIIGYDNPDKKYFERVEFFGKIQNKDLPQYLQLADAYLFPTLCDEGFGLSLVEALHCGLYCIASRMGGVEEVLRNGELGILIDDPFNVSVWVKEINSFLEKPKKLEPIDNELYSINAWSLEMNKLIKRIKLSFNI